MDKATDRVSVCRQTTFWTFVVSFSYDQKRILDKESENNLIYFQKDEKCFFIADFVILKFLKFPKVTYVQWTDEVGN